MRPVFQSRPGPDGDCYAACVASILEIEPADVPDLIGDRWASVLRDWLDGRRLRVDFRPGDGRPLGDQSDPPRGHAIVGQRVLDGSVHAVVCRDGLIVHDPSPRPFGHLRWPVVLWTLISERKTMIPEGELVARAAAPSQAREGGRLIAFFGDHDVLFVGEDARRALAALRAVPGLHLHTGGLGVDDAVYLPLKMVEWPTCLRILHAAGMVVSVAPLDDPDCRIAMVRTVRTRRRGESVKIGPDITVMIGQVSGSGPSAEVRVHVQAPGCVHVVWSEMSSDDGPTVQDVMEVTL
jgi:sRNA-binding carbon storage regulator CsrA